MPDLNSVPPSPHSLAASRRQSSSQMPPPPPPHAQAQAQAQSQPHPIPTSPSLNILPSNQAAVNQTSTSSLPSPRLAPSATVSTPPSIDNAIPIVGAGPGPLRHPRPLTAAELHLELEKEQEAVVNRLTRELSLLRAAHNASVVSNTSSTSNSTAANIEQHASDPNHLLSGSGFSIPSSTGRRHHRTSSSTSTRSQTGLVGSFSTTSVVGISAPAPTRPSARELSRHDSTASHRSQTSSPGPRSQPHSFTQSHLGDPAMAGYFHARGAAPTSVLGATPSSTSELSPGILQGTTRYEETAYWRTELDSVKRENESLKRRVRELERHIRDRRASDASRGRSESVSTTASVSVTAAGGGGGGTGIAGRREGGRDRVVSTLSVAGSVGVGVPEDEVQVGESAASAGLGPGGSGAAGRSGAN
ncbi:uncharacterized protein E0L32_004434 [Thyridium curvatum]|uniref:Uncharacterized protein n=1 Tax=Thyridium curvatum TaxID=1093900 RepID=A0A507BA14_9PEZI|nr:uncharacterized protein E0L32_004434 [Thyridium curvatum]TPX15454.1 hypothetical protein E0L32_004434 [Thyridium curvatum]